MRTVRYPKIVVFAVRTVRHDSWMRTVSQARAMTPGR
jgi:hypothetical protein